MEILKSKKVIIYLVVVLLLSTGISYAYFTATSTVNGKGASLTSKTADPATATVEAEGIVDFNNQDMYPGHKELVKVKVKGTGANEPIIYNLIFKGINTFNSNIKYTVYKTTTDEQASITCTPKTKVENGKQLLYETCTESLSSLGSSISTGSITKSEQEDKTTLKQEEVILTKESGNSLYYYIVIEYENVTDISKAQNSDKESSINGKITIEESKTKYEKPSVTLTASTQQNSESTNNGWYKTVSISGTIEGTGTKYTGSYCIDTTNTCEPNKNLTINGKSITAVSFPNNANEQILCMKVKDEYEQEINTCTTKYKVDNEVPTVRIESTSSTTNSITINVSASDTYSKVKTYYYSINGGSSYETSTTNSKTISVNEYKTYNIKVYVLDTAGNKSNEATTTVTVKNPYAARDKILADNKNIQSMPTTIAGPACNANTNNSGHSSGSCTMSDSGIYTTQDDEGTSYVYRGTIDNNWVKFGTTGTQTGQGDPIWWRIIRINGDGSVRMIYAGTGATAPADSTGKWASEGNKAQLDSISQFNDSRDNNAYVGYMYGSTTSDKWSETHANNNDSTIKKVLDDWYKTNLTDEATYLSDSAGFCGDRSSSTDTSTEPAQAGGTKKLLTYYGAYYRNVANKKPDLKCKYPSNDLYTVVGNQENKGNKKLQYPIGLITADEVTLAGGYTSSNYGYWLYTGAYYWTMSPYYFSVYALVFGVNTSGYLDWNSVNVANGVRPVINLKTETTFTGNGTISSPYEVS